MIRIIQDPVDPQELLRAASGEEVGGIASFFGAVRCQNAGKRVVAVEYHAYPTMAEKILARVAEEMQREFGPLRVALIHRIGSLGIGEISLGIAVGAPHRREALAAVAYAVERVKNEVPIWKREIYSDGSAWLEPAPASPPGAGNGERSTKGEGNGRF